jgi:voltage-gated potassium channel
MPERGVQPREITFSPSYQLAMLILSLYAIAALAAETAVRLDPQIRAVLDYADYAVCVLFLGDFVVSFWLAPRRVHYLLTWGWLDVLSSIPVLAPARWGRVARVVRIFRVLRGVRATKLITSALLRRRAHNTFLAATLLALLLVVVCSIAVLHFETAPESNIRTAEDAVWWAFATVTTVGYGDRYPVTPEGRFVAGILMCAGVGLFGTFSGFLAAWFLDAKGSGDSEIAALRKEIAALRVAIERQEGNDAGVATGSP